MTQTNLQSRLTKEQAETLPQFDASLRVDHDEHEQHWSAIYPPRSLNSIYERDPLGSAMSPMVPYSPITIGSLASLTSPMAPPYSQPPTEPIPDRDRY